MRFPLSLAVLVLAVSLVACGRPGEVSEAPAEIAPFLHVLAAEPSSVLRLPLDGGTGRDSGLEFVELRGGS